MHKKRIAASLLQGLGLLRLLESIPGKSVVYIINYHRVGDRDQGPFNQGVFSASPRQLEAELSLLSRQLQVLSADEILRLPEVLPTLKRDALIVTFDDGYRDNYEIAFPILQRLGIPGIFFIPTNILENPVLPWWDAISYLINNTKLTSITFDFQGTQQYNTANGQARTRTIRDLLRLIKDASGLDYAAFVERLGEACQVDIGNPRALACNLFMTPAMIREMHQENMLFGTQTHSHQILSHLNEQQQRHELLVSKQKLEQLLHAPVSLCSYPVGGLSAFTAATKRIAAECGYKLGFSFYGGLLQQSHGDWFDVPRESIEYDDTLAMIRTRIQMLRLFNYRF